MYLKQIFQQQQQHQAGEAEHADDEGVDPVESERDADEVSEKIQQKQRHEAESGVDEQLEQQLQRGAEEFQQQPEHENGGSDCQNVKQNGICHRKPFLLYCVRFFRSCTAQLYLARNALISKIHASISSGSDRLSNREYACSRSRRMPSISAVAFFTSACCALCCFL